MPEPETKEKPKHDPEAPLTSAELLIMKERYKQQPEILRLINAAITRRVMPVVV